MAPDTGCRSFSLRTMPPEFNVSGSMARDDSAIVLVLSSAGRSRCAVQVAKVSDVTIFWPQ